MGCAPIDSRRCHQKRTQNRYEPMYFISIFFRVFLCFGLLCVAVSFCALHCPSLQRFLCSILICSDLQYFACVFFSLFCFACLLLFACFALPCFALLRCASFYVDFICFHRVASRCFALLWSRPRSQALKSRGIRPVWKISLSRHKKPSKIYGSLPEAPATSLLGTTHPLLLSGTR